VEGVNKGSQRIRRMDPDRCVVYMKCIVSSCVYSPFPEDMQFDTLLGRYIYGEAERLQVH